MSNNIDSGQTQASNEPAVIDVAPPTTPQPLVASPHPGAPVPSTTKPHKSRLLAVVAAVVCLALAVAGVIYFLALRPSETQSEAIRTYFTYSQKDIDALKTLNSEHSTTQASIQRWQTKAYNLAENNLALDVDASKLYAYLAVAQMDAVALSQKAHGTYVGDIGSVSKSVLCVFYPKDCGQLLVSDEDAYSKKLADTVLQKVKERIAADNAQTKAHTLIGDANHWSGAPPQIGLSAGSFKPWFMSSGDQFRPASPPPAPGSAALAEQLAMVKKALAGATNEQKSIVVKWAGGPGTRTPPGIWLTLADDYMQANPVSLRTYLETRSLLTTSMADAVIGVFDAKYTYQAKRPFMIDPSIITIMPTPNHPSYPAGHATISWAAATVLATQLPANTTEWERLADEASNSRTIGGIHFPIDSEVGKTLGVNIGKEALKNGKQ